MKMCPYNWWTIFTLHIDFVVVELISTKIIRAELVSLRAYIYLCPYVTLCLLHKSLYLSLRKRGVFDLCGLALLMPTNGLNYSLFQ